MKGMNRAACDSACPQQEKWALTLIYSRPPSHPSPAPSHFNETSFLANYYNDARNFVEMCRFKAYPISVLAIKRERKNR